MGEDDGCGLSLSLRPRSESRIVLVTLREGVGMAAAKAIPDLDGPGFVVVV